MVELWVSLLRNGACVLKSLLPADYTVMQPMMTLPFLRAGRQSLDPFTVLEGFIGLLQLAGACFNIWKGIKVISVGTRSFAAMSSVVRWTGSDCNNHSKVSVFCMAL